MSTDEQPRVICGIPLSDVLRQLAGDVTSLFFIPVDEDQLFSDLDELIQRVHTPFSDIGIALRSNLSGMLSTVSMPFAMANRSAIDRHWQRIQSAEGIRSLKLSAEPRETEKELDSRREREALAKATPKMENFMNSSEGRDVLIRDILSFLERLGIDPTFRSGARETILQGAVLCWGAFEVFARDCFVAYVNANPNRTLALAADPIAKRRFELSKISIETLAAYSFNVSGHMGTLLAQQQDLSDVKSVKAVYQALFPDNEKLSDALNDADLRILSLRRNLIVHQRGVIDEIYRGSADCTQGTGEKVQLTPTDLEGHLRTTLRVSGAILDSVKI